jgi:light-regulated signal transduction histidine kinase (bacteriophytochrome)
MGRSRVKSGCADLPKNASRSSEDLEPHSVDLSALAWRIATDLQQTEPNRADEGLLRVALENRIGNTWKFTGKKPVSRIEFGALARPGDQKVYFVGDNGDGFDMTYADQLFGALQRNGCTITTNSRAPGSVWRRCSASSTGTASRLASKE